MELKVKEPFVDLVLGPIGEPANESVGLFKQDLRRRDDDPTDWCIEKDLPCDGVEGHLVIRFELIEEVVGRGGGGRFVVHDEERIIEGDDSVEMATEDVGGRRPYSCIFGWPL